MRATLSCPTHTLDVVAADRKRSEAVPVIPHWQQNKDIIFLFTEDNQLKI